jgi:hypothetical protein
MAVALHGASDGTTSTNTNPNETNKESTHKSGTTSTMQLLKGYLCIGIGILFLLGPILSSVLHFVTTTTSQDYNHDDDVGTTTTIFVHRLYEYWNETRPFFRVLTVLPATIVICICHWVSFRIYLRR